MSPPISTSITPAAAMNPPLPVRGGGGVVVVDIETSIVALTAVGERSLGVGRRRKAEYRHRRITPGAARGRRESGRPGRVAVVGRERGAGARGERGRGARLEPADDARKARPGRITEREV